MMRQLLVFALARIKGLKVTEAEDGVDGLRKLAADPAVLKVHAAQGTSPKVEISQAA